MSFVYKICQFVHSLRATLALGSLPAIPNCGGDPGITLGIRDALRSTKGAPSADFAPDSSPKKNGLISRRKNLKDKQI
jgi:hypothetical protein